MNSGDAIGFVARAEALRVRPVRLEEAQQARAEEVLEKLSTSWSMSSSKAKRSTSVPYLRLDLDAASGAWRVTGHGHEGHDNEPRMQLLVDWMRLRVLPLVDPAARPGVRGCWNVELHDSYAYLPNAATYDNCLSFSRPLDGRERVAMIPDPYQVTGYGGLLQAASQDRVPWAAKKPQLFFAGSTTGDRDAARNRRVQACIWSLRHPEEASFRITNVVQMSRMEACAREPRLREVLRPHVDVPEHHDYRYQVNIVGNTACWSRVPMVMASKSVLVHLRHRDNMWYYPMLKDGAHYLGADCFDDFLRVRSQLQANPGLCARVVADANRFVREYLHPSHADSYMAQLLEESAYHRAP